MKNKITPWLHTIGILIPLMGSGFIFFIRTFVPRLSNPSIVTLVFQILSLILLFSNKSYKTLYKGNYILFLIYSIFISYALFHFFTMNFEKGTRIVDIAYLLISITYLLFLHKIDYSISNKILIGVLILTFLINVSLIYASFSNPNFVIGMRATVNFSNTESYSGNPHVYAKNGLTSIIISLLFLFKTRHKYLLNYIFYWICLFTGIAVMFFTLVKTYIIISPLIIALFLLTFIPKNTPSKINRIESNKNYKPIYSFLIIIMSLFLFKSNQIDEIFQTYGNLAYNFTKSSINTILGTASTSGGIDESTYTRIYNLGRLKNLLFEHPSYYIFGNGYKFYYVDVPIAEIFQNFGVIGLGLFLTYFILIHFFSVKNILKSTDLFQIFISIYIFSTLLSTFTQGRPLDYSFFIHASFYIRFLGVNTFSEKHEITSLS